MPEIKKFIDLLESQLGYREKGDAYTKFGHWYGRHVESDAAFTSAPWCDMYISWAAYKLGYEKWIGQFAWTVEHAKWFKKQGAWGKKPEVGAIVFYDWGGTHDIDRIDHVGVVTKVKAGRIHTVEGNVDGGVAKRKERDSSKVVGYGYPERVKERLEKKQKKAGQRDGTIQVPEESLASLIPRPQTGRAASTSRLDSLGVAKHDPSGRGQDPTTSRPSDDRTDGRAEPRTGSKDRAGQPPTDTRITGKTPADPPARTHLPADSLAQSSSAAQGTPGLYAAHGPAGAKGPATGHGPARPQAPAADGGHDLAAPQGAAARQGAGAPDAAGPAPREGAHPEPGSGPSSVRDGEGRAGATSADAAKKGKHAKPTTADTTAAIAEPLPADADASATGPLPIIDSPTLIGSTLVAALTLIAVAKTRRLRLSAAVAAVTGPRTSASRAAHRRRRRPADRRLRRLLEFTTTPELLRSLDAATSTVSAQAATAQPPAFRAPARLRTAAQLEAVASLEAASAAVSLEVLASGGPAPSGVVPVPRPAPRTEPTAASMTFAGSHRAPRAASGDGLRREGREGVRRSRARHAARGGGARHARHRDFPYETRPFDLATDGAPAAPQRHNHAGHPTVPAAPQGRDHAGHAAHGLLAAPTGHHLADHPTGHPADRPAHHPIDQPGRRSGRHSTGGAFTPAFARDPYEPGFDRSRYAFTDDTGPLEVVLDTGPLRPVVDTGAFERVVIPAATSAFDAFNPPRRGRGDILDTPDLSDLVEQTAAYRGRRRRRASDERPAFADLAPRGRRHRTAPRLDAHGDLVGAATHTPGRHRA
ncbi:CHAP domain-containing protein [Nonomuraea maritima]|uniref:CHAP domain-containing protein n=1 Tax=Nonomuraea maritima TaxID=683260 RepID=A0A1G8TEK9_9ACTN|nr:CHAP domain-containing protein [Nonomuraea maritima]SDJ39863.1 CHAP domain-containing protein [Nonomuraea maritima]